jgi:hypothetical protein
MAITYGPVNQVNFNTISFVFYGDGTSTVLSVNLSKQPFNLTGFVAANPTSFLLSGLDPEGTTGLTATVAVAGSPDGDILTVTFNQPIPVPLGEGSSGGIGISPRYASLS